MAQAQPAAQPAQNPLDQLKDIHLPGQLDHFQLAPGWWILIAIGFGLIAYIFFKWNKKRKSLQLLIPANIELDKIAQSKPNNQAMAELSALLKRVCLIYFPKQKVAALSGDSWTKFINQQVGQELFTPSQQQVFSSLTYQANAQVEPILWDEIINNSRTAIDKIIRKGATEQLKKSTNKGSN